MIPEVHWFHDAMIVAVWSVFASTVVQGVTHLIAYSVLVGQDDQTDVGLVLKRRELSLGVKNVVRAVYDFLILIAITWETSFRNTGILMGIFIALALATWVAAYYAVRFVAGLRRERWGRLAPALSTFSAETSDTIDQTASTVEEVKADVKQIRSRMDDLDGAR